MKLTFEGQDYTLEFTRNSIKRMEESGFVLSEVSSKPMSNLPILFAGSFLANHKWVKQDTIDKIFENMTNKEDCMIKLIEMYSEPMEAMFDEPQGETEKNAVWEANF